MSFMVMSPYLYIIVSNYSAAVGIYTVTCLTAWNVGNIKNILGLNICMPVGNTISDAK